MLKKAFLAGINAYRDAPLRGCVNDVKAMQELLRGSLYEFKEENIKLITDREATTKAIEEGLAWLAEGDDEKAVRVFHYAGHGHFAPDKSGDESDGRDEALVPYDHQTAGYLIDDKLKKLYSRFSANSNLTLIMDCCNSGTSQRGPEEEDVYYRFMPNTYDERKEIAAAKKKFHEAQREFVRNEVQGFASVRGRDLALEKRIEEAMQKFEKQRFGEIRTRGGNILLAACEDDQQAADAKMAGTYHGAFTFYLVKFLRESQGKITYHDLIAKLGRTLYDHSFKQNPQLESKVERQKAQVLSVFD